MMVVARCADDDGGQTVFCLGGPESGIRAGNLDAFMYHARYVVEVGLLRCGGRRMGYCLFVCFCCVTLHGWGLHVIE
jgi:hypothetical protein